MQIVKKEQEHKPSNPPIFSIAPMIDVSNTHFRYFMRLITKKATLYTQMIHHDAAIHSHQKLLPFNQEEHPVVLQLGGCEPDKLAKAALLGQQYGYDQINLNVGCPSPRVQKGSFGACLMKEPDLVKECMEAMAKAVTIKCTVKCRLGVDNFDNYEFLKNFVDHISQGGKGVIKSFVIHARKAILKGLSPAQNRTIPPLIYQRVYQLKKDFPTLQFELNGGLKSVIQAQRLVDENNLDGCMVGRLAMQNPFELMLVDEVFYGEPNYQTYYQNDSDARSYVERLQKGEASDQFGHSIRSANAATLIKPLIHLYNGEQYCNKYRQFLSDQVRLKQTPVYETIRQVAQLMATGGFKFRNNNGQQMTEEEMAAIVQQQKEREEKKKIFKAKHKEVVDRHVEKEKQL